MHTCAKFRQSRESKARAKEQRAVNNKGSNQTEKTVFFLTLSEGGGISSNPKFPSQKKLKIFLDFLPKGGGGVSPNPKGF